MNAKRGFRYGAYEGGLTAELFVHLLRHLMLHRRARRIWCLTDRSHKMGLVKDCVAATDGRLTLHFMLGYTPELNPNELVWRHVKRTSVAITPLPTGEKL